MTMSSSFPVLVVPFVFALFAFSDLFFLVAGHDCGWNEKETKTLCWYTHVEGILLQLFSRAEQVLDPFHHQFWQLPILINYTISCTGNDKKDILYNQVSYLRSHLRIKKKKKKKKKRKKKDKNTETYPAFDAPYLRLPVSSRNRPDPPHWGYSEGWGHTLRPGPVLPGSARLGSGWARAAAFTSPIWTTFKSETWRHLPLERVICLPRRSHRGHFQIFRTSNFQ